VIAPRSPSLAAMLPALVSRVTLHGLAAGERPGPGPRAAGSAPAPASIQLASTASPPVCGGATTCRVSTLHPSSFDVASFFVMHTCVPWSPRNGERGGPRVQPSKQTTRCKAGYRATAQPPYSGCGRWGCAMRGVCVRMGAAVGTERSATPVTASTRSCDVCMSTVSCMHAHMCACMRPT